MFGDQIVYATDGHIKVRWEMAEMMHQSDLVPTVQVSSKKFNTVQSS